MKIPDGWQLYLYDKAMPVWCGWFDNNAGECVGFLARDGSVVSFDRESGVVTPMN